LGDRLVFFLGSLSYACYVGAQLLALLRHAHPEWEALQNMYGLCYSMVLVGAVINGWGNSLFWVGASKYVNESANNTNKGLFNAIFFVGNKTSMITGNLMAAYLVPKYSEAIFYEILTGLCFLMSLYFLFFIRKPLPQEDTESEEKIKLLAVE
jgi:predicted MFS family arabinose efflux permease